MFSRTTIRGLVVLAALALVVSCRKETAEDHFKKATEYIKTSQVDEAIIEYQLALKVDPKRGDIRSKLADAYLEKKDLGNAYREIIRAADLLPNDNAAQIRAGNFLLLAASRGGATFEDAKARADKVLARDPNNVEAQILLGNAFAGLKDWQNALNEYQEATALDPTSDAAYASAGMVQFARGNKAEAEASFRKAVAAAPKSLDARLALANFLLATGRAPEAESTLKAALELDSTNVQANRALGSFYLATNRLKDAEPYFAAIAAQTHASSDAIALADYYLIANRHNDARRVLTDLAANSKDFAVATTRLATIDAIEGQRALAHQKVQQVIQKYPKDMSARLLEARLLLVDGKRDEALKQATSIVSEEPTSAQAVNAYMLIGAINATLDQFEDAEKAYQEVLKRQSRPLAADLALAAISLRTRQFDKAASFLQQAETIQPQNPAARVLRVRLLLAEHKTAEAKEALASLEKQYPNSAEVLKLAGAQQLIDHQYDAARASYTKALQAAPNDIEAATGLIGVDLASGRKNDALQRVEAGLKTAQPSTELYLLAGRTYATTGDYKKAEEYFVKATELDPAKLEAYAMLGQLYTAQHRLPDAIDQYQKVVERVPNSVAGHTMLGMLHESNQQGAEAEKEYQKVLSIDSHAPVAANNLAWIYVSSNRNLDQALQLAQTALQGLPNEPHVNDTLGWVYYRKDMASAAVPYLEASVEKNPDDPTGFYHLGMAYVRVGDLEKGRKSLQRAVASKVEFDGIAEARKTLAQLGG